MGRRVPGRKVCTGSEREGRRWSGEHQESIPQACSLLLHKLERGCKAHVGPCTMLCAMIMRGIGRPLNHPSSSSDKELLPGPSPRSRVTMRPPTFLMTSMEAWNAAANRGSWMGSPSIVRECAVLDRKIERQSDQEEVQHQQEKVGCGQSRRAGKEGDGSKEVQRGKRQGSALPPTKGC